MTLTNCTLSNNVATNAGGGIINYNPGTLTVNTSTLSGNIASDVLGRASSGFGGGIENNGTLTLNGGDFSDNRALLAWRRHRELGRLTHGD